MDHHTSWLSYLPGYAQLLAFMKERGDHTEQVSASGITTVHHIYAALIVAVLLMIMSVMARSRIADTEKAVIPPRSFGIVAFFELFLEVLMGLMQQIIGPSYKRYVPVVGSLGLFILVSSLLGLVPGMQAATNNLNTTLACGLLVFVYFNYHAIRVNGFHHITHLLNPVGAWWGYFLAPIELFSLLLRPLTLAIRLAANMVADHAVLLAFAGIFPLLLPLPFYVLGLLVCLIQSAVFVILTCVYIGLHAAEQEHAAAHH